MTSRSLVALCLGGSVLSGALAGTAVAWLRSSSPQPALSAQRGTAPSKPESAVRLPLPDTSDVESRITELEDRLEAMQSQERARRGLQKYAEAVAAGSKEDTEGARPAGKPHAGGVVDAEDPAFELAVRSVLDQVDWEKDEERKATRQQRRNERAQRQVEMYTERLQLSSEQQQALGAVLAQQMEQFRALSDDDEAQGPPLTRAERRERGTQIRAQTEQRLAEVLTPEQLVGYRAVVEEQFQGRRDRAEPAPSASVQ